MAAVSNPSELPNLKIEIENYIDEAMETDDGGNQSDSKLSKDEIEEGEISDTKDTEPCSVSGLGSDMSAIHDIWEKRYENKSGGFVTGIDFFGEDQSKLDERAKRFGLDPVEVKSVSDKEFKKLYQSLGMKLEDAGAEKHYRLNTLHMRGTEEMSTQDIFAYFKDYCAASIEWINDYTCNVVWLDESSAARALLGLSKQIKGLKNSVEKGNPFSKDYKNEDAKEEVGEAVTSKDSESVMVVDDSQDKDGDSEAESDDVKDNFVLVSDITSPIPPGLWRKGIEHPKAKCILLRFATRSDRKPPGAEKMSDYYKKYGNPNYGGIKGLITSSRKRRYRRTDVPPKPINFEDDLGDGREYRDAGKMEDSKNPWGNLAKSWSNIDKNRGKKKPEPYYADSPPRRMTPPPSPQMDFVKSRSILKRLGTLDGMSRIHRTTHNSEEESASSCEDDMEWTRRSKVPRMRMYADEEEMRMVRRKGVTLQGSSQRESSESWRDLRLDDRDRDSRQSRDRETSEHVSRSRVRNSEDLRSRLERDRRGHSGQRGTRNWLLSSKSGRRTASPKAKSRLDDLESESESESVEDNLEEEGFSARITDLRSTLNSGKKQRVEFQAEDLRSKLNKKKTLKHFSRPKSPLRIEIDNDEYYRLIESDHE
ncbi:Uncharacterized protein GBIM_09324 [Gryllus bimaculatus]|nr:Uncharacterized protein GBIM_09324 [Gryllus bimaculatus]